MPVKYALNTYDGEIIRYTEAEGITDFPRGLWLAYRDFIVTGLESHEAARAARKEYIPCRLCRNVACASISGGKVCPFCKADLLAPATDSEEGR